MYKFLESSERVFRVCLRLRKEAYLCLLVFMKDVAVTGCSSDGEMASGIMETSWDRSVCGAWRFGLYAVLIYFRLTEIFGEECIF